MKKGLVFTALIAAFGIGLAACGQTPAAPKEYVVTIANKTALQEEWKDTPEDFRTAAITIKGKNHDEVVDFYQAVDDKDLVFTSSDDSVLTVAGYGIITCQGAGKSTITATYKDKFSDSVEITVSQEEALRPAFELDPTKDYILGMTPASGTTVYATGKMSGYYLGTDKLDNAATAKVSVANEATGDYKYVITLTYKDGNNTITKTIGSYNSGDHINIGFVEDTDTYTFATAYFKFNSNYTFSTIISDVEYFMGTYSNYNTISYRDANVIAFPAYLYEEGDPIHAETVAIDLDQGQTEITLRPGFSKKLTYTVTPNFVTDSPKWSSDNLSAVEVQSSGLISAVGEAGSSANITLRLHRKTATVKVNISGNPLNYGTESQPLTVAEAKAQLDELGDNFYTVKPMYITGVVGEVEAWSEADQWRNVWLQNADGSVAKEFELYRVKEAQGESKVKNLLAGQTVVAMGYAEKFVGSYATYELTPAKGENPKLVSVTVPDLEDINVPAKLKVKVEAQKDVVVTAEPKGAVLPTVTLSWKDTTQDVAEIVEGKLAIKGLKIGTTTLVVTAGTFSKEVPVEIIDAAGEKVSLTAESLLGYDGSGNKAYSTDYQNATVSGVAFTYQQIGAYKSGHAGMQFRNKLSDSSNKTKSNLYNTAAFDDAISSIDFVWHSSKDIKTNTNVLKITFDKVATFDGANQEVVYLNTVADVKTMSVAPEGDGFTFVKIEIDDAFTYTCYWASIDIVVG